MSRPFFSFDGLAFKTPGDDDEFSMNLKISMKKLEDLALGKPVEEEHIDLALAFLEDKIPKVAMFCDHIRDALRLDDFTEAEIRQAILRRAYNRIVDRLSG